MSVLDAAKQLASADIGTHCDFCTGSPISGHFEGCPVRAAPQIVAALEAAERVLFRIPRFDEGDGLRCSACDALLAPLRLHEGHESDCPTMAFVALLKGEVVP